MPDEERLFAAPPSQRPSDSLIPERPGAARWGLQRVAPVYARIALAAAFLSAVAARFGLWSGRGFRASFDRFVDYTAQVNSFMPAATIPSLAWAATALELSLGVALLVGLRLRWIGLAASGLLVLFGLAMAISFGVKEPLDYSVFSASAGALLLAVDARRQGR
jgi:putative oxidoreductase